MPQLEPSLNLADFRVEPGHARPLLAQGLNDHRRQPLRDPLESAGHTPSHTGPALRHDFAVFGQQAAQAVDLGGAELHQLLAHAVQRQYRLLLLTLDRDRLDARLLNRDPDRPRIVCIALVAAHKRPDHLRRQQPDLVAQLSQSTRPMLRAAARLHPDQARRAIGKVLQELCPCQLQTHDLARLHIDPVQLKHPSRRIHADDRSASLHLGPSGLPVKSSLFQLGTLMPSARKGPPPPSAVRP